MGQLSAVFDVIEQNGAVLGFGVAFLALAAMLAAFLFLSYRDYRRQVRQEQQFLTMQFQLLQNHYQSIQTQMSRMEACQKLVDAQMAEIMKLESDMISEANSEQLAIAERRFQAEKSQNMQQAAILSILNRSAGRRYQNIRAGICYQVGWCSILPDRNGKGAWVAEGELSGAKFSCDTGISQEKLAHATNFWTLVSVKMNNQERERAIHAHTDTEYSASNSDCIQDGGGRTAAKSQTMGSANRKGIWCRD